MADVAPIRKGRLVIGAMFIAVGLSALTSDLLDTSLRSASATGILAGSLVLLVGLILGARRNRSAAGDLSGGEWDT